jgi:hypothetical protein
MDYFDVSTGSNCIGAWCCPTGQTFALSPPLPLLEGYAYKVSLRQLSDLGDTAEVARSPAIICEGDHRMGPGHIPYAEIAQKGLGRFSHYEKDVVFSSSDNTDPNSNGRQYTVVIPSSKCRGLAFLIGLC